MSKSDSVKLREGVYTIEHVLQVNGGGDDGETNHDLSSYTYTYASARRRTKAPIVGSLVRDAEFVQEWYVSVVHGSEDTYVITAPDQLPPIGWTTEPVEGYTTGSPVVYMMPPKKVVIRYVEEMSRGRGPEEQAFTIMIPGEGDRDSFYVRQIDSLPIVNPPVQVSAIPDTLTPAPFWIFKPVEFD